MRSLAAVPYKNGSPFKDDFESRYPACVRPTQIFCLFRSAKWLFAKKGIREFTENRTRKTISSIFSAQNNSARGDDRKNRQKSKQTEPTRACACLRIPIYMVTFLRIVQSEKSEYPSASFRFRQGIKALCFAELKDCIKLPKNAPKMKQRRAREILARRFRWL